MTTKPMMLLDVDGVLNAEPLSYDEGSGFTHTRVDGTFVSIPDGTTARIARLLEVYDPVWATAWESRAHLAWARPLGLGETAWPHIEFKVAVRQIWNDELWEPSTWKLEPVKAFAELTGRPLIWIDDDLAMDAYRWAHQRTASGIDTFLLKTDPVRGLDDDIVKLALGPLRPRVPELEEAA